MAKLSFLIRRQLLPSFSRNWEGRQSCCYSLGYYFREELRTDAPIFQHGGGQKNILEKFHVNRVMVSCRRRLFCINFHWACVKQKASVQGNQHPTRLKDYVGRAPTEIKFETEFFKKSNRGFILARDKNGLK